MLSMSSSSSSSDEEEEDLVSQVQRKRVKQTEDRQDVDAPMRLKYVSISNFSCYGEDQHVIGPFNKHLNCVVGVNGSGKSSIFAAISWCLGSRETHVNRKACVSLTFTREGMADIVVARRPGKYSLNGRSSTLKNIAAVLADGGFFLTNQTRWFIKQAKTVEIATQGPLKLLSFVEDVVGTSELRADIEEKREALNTQQERLEELGTTAKEHYATLEALKADVEEFEEYDERRSNVAQLAASLQIFERALQLFSKHALEQDVASAETNVKACRKLVSELKEEQDALPDISALKDASARARSGVDVATKAVSQRSSAVAVLKTRLKQIERSQKAAGSHKSALENELESAALKLESLGQQQRLLDQYDCEALCETARLLQQAARQRAVEEAAQAALQENLSERQHLERQVSGLRGALSSAPDRGARGDRRAQPLAACVAQEGAFLCEICECEEASSLAMNCVLGPLLRSTVVVQSRSVARTLVSRCRERRAGIVTCEILDELPSRVPPLPSNSLVRLVQCAPRFSALLFRLLGSWVFVEGASEAQQVMRAGVYNAVTRGGDLYRRGGSMVGGLNQTSKAGVFAIGAEAKSVFRGSGQSGAPSARYKEDIQEEIEYLMSRVSACDGELNHQRALLSAPRVAAPSEENVHILSEMDANTRRLLDNGISSQCTKARLRVAAIRRELDACSEAPVVDWDCREELARAQRDAAAAKEQEAAARQEAKECHAAFKQMSARHSAVGSKLTKASSKLALAVRAQVKASAAMRRATTENCIDEEERAKAKSRKWIAEGVDLGQKQARLAARSKRLSKETAGLRVAFRKINPRSIQRYVEHADALGVVEKHIGFLESSAAQEAAELERLERRRYELVTEALRDINRAFGPLFSELSVHGEATLEYVRDRKVLFMEGVLLLVKPDATCFKRFGALSGGQRAMSALSFMLAVQQAFPSPLFLLDEVDAALDVQAASRAALMIREHAERGAQFLCVSLRHQFYTKAHQLVGVYTTGDTSRAVCVEM